MFCLEKVNSVQKPCKPTFDFSIDSLLKKETSQSDGIKKTKFQHETITLFSDLHGQLSQVSSDDKINQADFNWLSCTRFKPPKLPRSRKRVGCKRYGRGPRIPFAPQQIAVLENTFTSSQYLSSECIHHLAKSLNLTETRVKIWFQNRRARFRRERESPNTISSVSHTKMKSLPMQATPTNLTKGTSVVQTISSKTKNLHHSHRNNMSNSSSGGNSTMNKRKLLIPNYLSLQIKNQCQSNPFSLPSNKTTSSSVKNTNNNTFSTNIAQSMQLNSLSLPYLSSLSSGEFSLSYSNPTPAHFSRILCGTSNSAFAPVNFPFPTSHI